MHYGSGISIACARNVRVQGFFFLRSCEMNRSTSRVSGTHSFIVACVCICVFILFSFLLYGKSFNTHTAHTTRAFIVCVLVPQTLGGAGCHCDVFSHDVNLMCVHSIIISLYVRTLNNFYELILYENKKRRRKSGVVSIWKHCKGAKRRRDENTRVVSCTRVIFWSIYS